MLGTFGLAIATLVSAPDKDVTVLAKVPDGYTVVDDTLRFARNGSNVAFVVRKGTKVRPFASGKLGDEYDSIAPPVMHPSGEHVAFRVLMIDRIKSPRGLLLYDGKSIASDDWIGEVALSPTDGTPAYWLSRSYLNVDNGSIGHGPTLVLQFGKVKSKKWQGIEDQIPPCFTADGKSVFSVGSHGGDACVMALDAKGKETKFCTGPIIEATVNAQGKRIAWSSLSHANGDPKITHKYSFVIHRRDVAASSADLAQQLGSDYPSAADPVFAPNGNEIAYRVEVSGKFGVAINDAMGAACEYDFVDGICWSPDSGAVAFIACHGCKLNARDGFEIIAGTKASGGKWVVVVDDKPTAEYDEVRSVCWSRDSKFVAYAACIGEKWRVYIGTKSTDEYDDISDITWADDGKSVNFGARQGDEISWRKFAIE